MDLSCPSTFRGGRKDIRSCCSHARVLILVLWGRPRTKTKSREVSSSNRTIYFGTSSQLPPITQLNNGGNPSLNLNLDHQEITETRQFSFCTHPSYPMNYHSSTKKEETQLEVTSTGSVQLRTSVCRSSSGL